MRSKSAISWKVVVFIIILTIPFMVMTFHQLTAGDYPDHIEFVVELAETGAAYALPHTLFAKSVLILRALIPFNLIVHLGETARSIVQNHSYEIATMLLMALTYAFTIFVIWKRSFAEFTDQGIKKASLWSMIVTIVLMFVAPIFFFTYPDRQYLGYFAFNPFHNPTFILLKPLALVWFFIATENLFKRSESKLILATALVVFLATSAKPSFTVTLLPAIGLVWLFFYTRKFKELNWPLLIGGMGVAAVLVILTQFLVTYSAAGTEKSVEKLMITPFKTLLSYSGSYFLLGLKILMSLVFPLYITITDWEKVKGKVAFQLGWMNFLVGLVMAILLSEEIRYQHGNFIWSPMAGVFILFVVTLMHYARSLAAKIEQKQSRWTDWVPIFLLALHLICGFIYYFNALVAPKLVI